MRRWLLAGLLAVLFAAPLSAAELKSGHPWGESVPWYCDGIYREAVWTNIWGQTIYVRRVKVLAGSSGGQVSDIHYRWRIDNGVDDGTRTLSEDVIDHYTNYTGRHNDKEEFGTHYMLILPGERMVLRYRCTLFAGPSETFVTPILWYSTTP